ncbi:MAG: tripartite tricarboxylate transporter TctB family protein [Pseudolabrys sp.]
MNIRSDHVAGAAFVAFGVLIIALSGDLPTGQLSMPGSGFMPKLVAGLTIILGIALFARARESGPLAELGWSDAKHAVMVVAITAAGIALYTVIGFILTLVLMMTALLVIIERRNPLRAVGYSAAIVMLTYYSFEYLLKTPLPEGPFGF